ncbi:AfsR/SARP family transcriptional regulator [Arthrobacter sp. MPF02]|uniref:AfsR/SARP family transcriptional regulator n=1 Tax=Arthrobacter sp. MPF02 TaxID=3388492 RepID=UPI003984DFF7
MGNVDYGIYELDLMQSWQLRQGGSTLHVAARQQRLIAALAVRGPSLRTYIAGMLWPEYPEAKALESLRVTVHLVSRQLPGLLVKDGALLSLHHEVDVDLHAVRLILKEAALPGGTTAAGRLQELRDLEFLPGWYEDWVLFEQGRLRHDRLRAFSLLSRQFAGQGNHEAAAEAAIAALAIEPLYESAVRVLVAAELAQGNVASAMLAYEKYREQLSEDMGVTPSDALRKLISGATGQRPRSADVQLVPAGSSRLIQQPLLDNV